MVEDDLRELGLVRSGEQVFQFLQGKSHSCVLVAILLKSHLQQHGARKLPDHRPGQAREVEAHEQPDDLGGDLLGFFLSRAGILEERVVNPTRVKFFHDFLILLALPYDLGQEVFNFFCCQRPSRLFSQDFDLIKVFSPKRKKYSPSVILKAILQRGSIVKECQALFPVY